MAVELLPPSDSGLVFATTDEPVDQLTVIVDGPGHAAISEHRDYLVPRHRHHVATVLAPATVTVWSAGVEVASELFDQVVVSRRRARGGAAARPRL